MSKEASREKLVRRVNWVVNVALVLAGVALVVVLARSFFGGRTVEPLKAGARLNLNGVAWNESRETLVMALSSECRYCTESAPFYQRLVSDLRAGVRRVSSPSCPSP